MSFFLLRLNLVYNGNCPLKSVDERLTTTKCFIKGESSGGRPTCVVADLQGGIDPPLEISPWIKQVVAGHFFEILVIILFVLISICH